MAAMVQDFAHASRENVKQMASSEQIPFLRLGVNIDHVATVRNARGGDHPDPVRAANLASDAGADGITAHLREDRRHIIDEDIELLKNDITLPLNLEMAPTREMLAIALKHLPHACCLVPERRQEVTTEGGLDVITNQEILKPVIAGLQEKNIRASLFIEPNEEHIAQAQTLGADIVELHTGRYAEAALHGSPEAYENQLERIRQGAQWAAQAGLEVHAGHGLTYNNVGNIAAIPQIVELNIGHFLVSEAIFSGLYSAILRMRALMDSARAKIDGSRSA